MQTSLLYTPSAKQQQLIALYSDMVLSGYTTIKDVHIKTVFSDMEIRFFKKPVKGALLSVGAQTLLDYGCGGSNYLSSGFQGDLSAKEYFELKDVYRYEPSRNIDERQPADAVVCFDVLEHIFVADIPRVVRELFSLTKKLLIVNVACYKAAATLPNGENAHITVRPPFWWKGVFDTIAVEYPDIEVKLWCSEAWRKPTSFKAYRALDWVDSATFEVPVIWSKS
ncbi:MAG: hypothetical protein PHN51_10315 [Candidatus Nanopelagicales bacterium]|nr:hypothetical protein [Candidatus Nanopelagicales bacterium]